MPRTMCRLRSRYPERGVDQPWLRQRRPQRSKTPPLAPILPPPAHYSPAGGDHHVAVASQGAVAIDGNDGIGGCSGGKPTDRAQGLSTVSPSAATPTAIASASTVLLSITLSPTPCSSLVGATTPRLGVSSAPHIEDQPTPHYRRDSVVHIDVGIGENGPETPRAKQTFVQRPPPTTVLNTSREDKTTQTPCYFIMSPPNISSRSISGVSSATVIVGSRTTASRKQNGTLEEEPALGPQTTALDKAEGNGDGTRALNDNLSTIPEADTSLRPETPASPRPSTIDTHFYTPDPSHRNTPSPDNYGIDGTPKHHLVPEPVTPAMGKRIAPVVLGSAGQSTLQGYNTSRQTSTVIIHTAPTTMPLPTEDDERSPKAVLGNSPPTQIRDPSAARQLAAQAGPSSTRKGRDDSKTHLLIARVASPDASSTAAVNKNITKFLARSQPRSDQSAPGQPLRFRRRPTTHPLSVAPQPSVVKAFDETSNISALCATAPPTNGSRWTHWLPVVHDRVMWWTDPLTLPQSWAHRIASSIGIHFLKPQDMKTPRPLPAHLVNDNFKAFRSVPNCAGVDMNTSTVFDDEGVVCKTAQTPAVRLHSSDAALALQGRYGYDPRTTRLHLRLRHEGVPYADLPAVWFLSPNWRAPYVWSTYPEKMERYSPWIFGGRPERSREIGMMKSRMRKYGHIGAGGEENYRVWDFRAAKGAAWSTGGVEECVVEMVVRGLVGGVNGALGAEERGKDVGAMEIVEKLGWFVTHERQSQKILSLLLTPPVLPFRAVWAFPHLLLIPLFITQWLITWLMLFLQGTSRVDDWTMWRQKIELVSTLSGMVGRGLSLRQTRERREQQYLREKKRKEDMLRRFQDEHGDMKREDSEASLGVEASSLEPGSDADAEVDGSSGLGKLNMRSRVSTRRGDIGVDGAAREGGRRQNLSSSVESIRGTEASIDEDTGFLRERTRDGAPPEHAGRPDKQQVEIKGPWWIVGGDGPTEADFVVYGFLASVMATPTQPQMCHLLQSSPTLVKYMLRIHETYFPDYEPPEVIPTPDASMTGNLKYHLSRTGILSCIKNLLLYIYHLIMQWDADIGKYLDEKAYPPPPPSETGVQDTGDGTRLEPDTERGRESRRRSTMDISNGMHADKVVGEIEMVDLEEIEDANGLGVGSPDATPLIRGPPKRPYLPSPRPTAIFRPGPKLLPDADNDATGNGEGGGEVLAALMSPIDGGHISFLRPHANSVNAGTKTGTTANGSGSHGNGNPTPGSGVHVGSGSSGGISGITGILSGISGFIRRTSGGGSGSGSAAGAAGAGTAGIPPAIPLNPGGSRRISFANEMPTREVASRRTSVQFVERGLESPGGVSSPGGGGGEGLCVRKNAKRGGWGGDEDKGLEEGYEEEGGSGSGSGSGSGIDSGSRTGGRTVRLEEGLARGPGDVVKGVADEKMVGMDIESIRELRLSQDDSVD